MFFTLLIFAKKWDYIERSKRASMLLCFLVVVAVVVFKAVFPELLIVSIGPVMFILGIYVKQENPVITELSHYHYEMVMGFATLVENRDDSTGGHIRRTSKYVEMLSKQLRKRGYYREILTKDYIKNLMLAAPMHDVGKIAVPDAILQKPGKLTDEEFEEMKKHALYGGKIIQDTAYDVSRHHHEKWNGRGYPDGLKMTEIPLCARIMAVADVFDAVSEKRCYRDALPLEKCFSIIEEGRGTDFEPLLVDVFLEMRNKIEEIHGSINSVVQKTEMK